MIVQKVHHTAHGKYEIEHQQARLSATLDEAQHTAIIMVNIYRTLIFGATCSFSLYRDTNVPSYLLVDGTQYIHKSGQLFQLFLEFDNCFETFDNLQNTFPIRPVLSSFLRFVLMFSVFPNINTPILDLALWSDFQACTGIENG